MQLSAARIDQVVGADADGMIIVDRDVGGVVENIKRLDPHLNVRFSPQQKFFAVYWSSDDGRETYLVSTIQAHKNSFGTWEGLDNRIVHRLEQIDSQNRSGYNYARALEQQQEAVRKLREAARGERLGELGERAAHAVRKDLGAKSRAVIPGDVQ